MGAASLTTIPSGSGRFHFMGRDIPLEGTMHGEEQSFELLASRIEVDIDRSDGIVCVILQRTPSWP